MLNFKDHIAKQFIGKSYHFKCDCLLHMDFTGEILDYEIVNNEIIFIIDADRKIVRIGENHPNMMVESV